MSKRFVMSDPHFSHESSWAKWKKADGITPVRPFTSTQEMNETIIENARKVVGKNDILYVLGDLAMTREGAEWAKLLPGRKRLALGNHDELGAAHYLGLGFEEVGAMYEVKIGDIKAVMTHFPVHPFYVTERWNLNIHGHLHDQQVEMTYGSLYPETRPDWRYLCASVEQIDYTPILLESS